MKRFHQFFKWMKGNKRYYFIAATILIVLQYFRTLTPLFVRHALDLVNGEEDSGLPEFLLDIIADDSVKRELLLLAIAKGELKNRFSDISSFLNAVDGLGNNVVSTMLSSFSFSRKVSNTTGKSVPRP